MEKFRQFWAPVGRTSQAIDFAVAFAQLKLVRLHDTSHVITEVSASPIIRDINVKATNQRGAMVMNDEIAVDESGLSHLLRSEEWEVRPAELKIAQELVRSHHYSKGGSNTACYVHGLFNVQSGKLHGVAWWLPPTRVACESVNAQHWQRVISLTRMVMVPDTPKNACSFLLARSVRLIKQDRRFMSLVTYADESQGHSGGVYKASNWHYVGRTGPYPRWIDPQSGRQVAPKATRNRTKAQMEALGYEKQGPFFKHKYVLHLWKNEPANDNRRAANDNQRELDLAPA